MNPFKNSRLAAASLLGVGTLLLGSRGTAYELKLGDTLPPLDLHGFVSQGFLYSKTYNFLSDDTTGGSAKFFEAGLSTTFNPFPRTRVAAQAFAFDVGHAGEYRPILDFAHVEYTFDDALGLRVGRVRRSEGISNHIQDVDLARTWVLLPQSVYNARWRDSYASIDGVELFGNLPLHSAGSLSYELYSGRQRPKLNGGLALQKSNLPPYSPLTAINSPLLSGGQVWWNTPLAGLRLGVALNEDHNLTFVTLNGTQTKGSPFTRRYSVEYLRGPWTFQTEYNAYNIDYTISGPGRPNAYVFLRPSGWYASAAYRFNPWVEAGSYYAEYYGDRRNRSGAGMPFPSDASQKDLTFSVRVDPTNWWILKIEGHRIRGTGQLLDTVSNPVRHGDAWWMLAVKSTFTF